MIAAVRALDEALLGAEADARRVVAVVRAAVAVVDPVAAEPRRALAAERAARLVAAVGAASSSSSPLWQLVRSCSLATGGLALTNEHDATASESPRTTSARSTTRVEALTRGSRRATIRRVRVLAIQAGLGGEHGNGAVLLHLAAEHLAPHATVERATLDAASTFADHEAALARADAIVIATGTYWDSWSSHLQRFLEGATPSEGTALWLGKPVGVLVSAHSVGGKGVLSRLQGVLVTLGALVPPMSGLVVTLASEKARAAGGDHVDDLFGPGDLDVVCHNLLEAARGGRAFRAWPVDRRDPGRRWLGRT